MSTNEAPAPPNYQPIADAQMAASQHSDALAREQFDWAKKAYADNRADTSKINDQFLATQTRNDLNAQADRKRYENEFQPLEDNLAKDATDYASPERKAIEMGRAGAAVSQSFDAQRNNAARDLESFGINPGSTRFAALDIGVRAQQAAAVAGASNQAAQMVDATGRALRSEAINVGRGYPGQIAGTYNTALQAGTGANNNNIAVTGSGANTMGTAPGYSAQAAGSLSGAASTMNTSYANSMAQYKANQENSPAAALGAAAGIGAKMMFMADGGEVDPADGHAVPESASPTRGKAVDDVPARLSVGEFVIPRQAVEWFGQKHFYGLIEKADAARSEAKARTQAVPTVHPAAMRPPAFVSRSAVQA